MPNWCSCDLTIKAEFGVGNGEIQKFMEDMKRLKEETGREILSAEYFIPYPKGFKDQDELVAEMRKKGVAWDKTLKDGYNQGGYGWCISNWGTKWDLTRVEVAERYESEHEEGEYDNWFGFTFETAWSPPLPIVLEMSRRYPEIEFILEWYEMGMGKRGLFKAKAGEVINEEEGAYYGDRGG